MRLLLVKDGTIPVVVARVLATDIDADDLAERTGDYDLGQELFEVPDDAEAIDVTWRDDMGFTFEATTVAQWMRDRQEDDGGGPIEPVTTGHFVQSDISHGKDD